MNKVVKKLNFPERNDLLSQILLILVRMKQFKGSVCRLRGESCE